MADLAFAAQAAEDNCALEILAQTQTATDPNTKHTPPISLDDNDWSNVPHVDDLDVAASAANAEDLCIPIKPDPRLIVRSRCSMDDIMMDEAALLSDSDDEMEDDSSQEDSKTPIQSHPDPTEKSQKISVSFSVLDETDPSQKAVFLTLSTENTAPALEKMDGSEDEDDKMEVEQEQHSEEESLSQEFREITLNPSDELKPVGAIRSKVDGNLVIQAESLTKPLEAGSILFGMDGVLIGKVIEIFGTVQDPFYVVTIPKDLDHNRQSPGTRVCHVDRYSHYIDLHFKDVESEDESEEEVEENVSTLTGRFATMGSTRPTPRKRRPQHQAPFQHPRRNRSHHRPLNNNPTPHVIPSTYTQQHAGFHPYFPPHPPMVQLPPGVPPGYVITPVPVMVYQPYNVVDPEAKPQSNWKDDDDGFTSN